MSGRFAIRMPFGITLRASTSGPVTLSKRVGRNTFTRRVR